MISETLGNGIKTVRGHDAVTGQLDYLLSGPNANGAVQNLSYEWDKVGNLVERTDSNRSLTESFSYDSLGRLDYSTLNGSINLDLTYNEIGNITQKSDVGSYAYHATKKHAVTSAGSNTYSYDANGNANVRNGSTIDWYSFNLPKLINGSANNSSQFSYAPDRSRWKQVANYNGTSVQTIYIGGLVEKVTVGADVTWKHYIAGGNGPVAVHTRRSSGVNDTVYLLKDHLGSTDVITDASGNALAAVSSEAYGKRRNGQTWSGEPPASIDPILASSTRRGFTFHEMLDNVDLIHMNGRVFDPEAGRFLSADPFVQAPYFSQSLNRYSYAFNNPLNGVDPSGFGLCLIHGSGADSADGNGAGDDCTRVIDILINISEYLFDNLGGSGNGAGSSEAFARLSQRPELATPGPSEGCQECGGSSEQSLNRQLPTTSSPVVSDVSLGTAGLRGEVASTVGGFGNDGVMSPIYVSPGTVAMNLPNYVYQQCAMSMCHGNVDLPFTHGYLTEAESRELAMNAGLTVGSFAVTGVLGAARTAAVIDTAAVRFTQSSVSGTFSDGRALQATIDALKGPGGDVLAG